VRISPTAYLWIARYLAERPPGPPAQPVWMTLRGGPRPVTYWAMRQVLERTNQIVGSNVTMHDFRHTVCMRLAQITQPPGVGLPRAKSAIGHTNSLAKEANHHRF
jgi:integrase/recombinase XerC